MRLIGAKTIEPMTTAHRHCCQAYDMRMQNLLRRKFEHERAMNRCQIFMWAGIVAVAYLVVAANGVQIDMGWVDSLAGVLLMRDFMREFRKDDDLP